MGPLARVVPTILLLLALRVATGEPEEAVLFTNDNPAAVRSGPPKETRFVLARPATIAHVRVYHHAGGRGAPPGWIRLDDPAGGLCYGPYAATGVAPRPGGGALYWECRPDLDLPAGTYVVVVSSPATWSWNEASGFAGIAVVRGRWRKAPPPPATPKDPPPTAPPPADPSAAGPPAAGPTGFFTMRLLPREEALAGGDALSVTDLVATEEDGRTHRVGASTRLVLPDLGFVNEREKACDLVFRVTLRQEPSARSALLFEGGGAHVPAWGVDGSGRPGEAKASLPRHVTLLEHLDSEPAGACDYVLRIEAVEPNGLPAAIRDVGVRLFPFRLDGAGMSRDGEAFVVTLTGPATTVPGARAVVLLPSGQRVDARDLLGEDALETEPGGTDRVRLRIPADLPPCLVLLEDSEGRRTNALRLAVP